MSENGRRRLTSWKEIASHLGREVRTVLRWEKERGLPVYRVPGGSGRVVFAYTDELDAWSRGEPPVASPEAEAGGASVPPPASSTDRPIAWRRWAPATILLVTAVAIAGWRVGTSRANEGPLTIEMHEDGMTASEPDGSTRWRYTPPRNTLWRLTAGNATVDLLGTTDPYVVGATAYAASQQDGTVRSGELLALKADGSLFRSFSFDDRLTFASGTYGAPWGLTDFRVQDAAKGRRIAVAAHHFEWWPSIVTVLDAKWRRTGTFVHAGWIERLLWIGPDRLVISGFSNARDGAVVALLDASKLDGHSPDPPGGEFACTSCAAGGPIRYVVMPRSEVNRASGSPFNRVTLTPIPAGVLARTIEVPAEKTASDALYEFTPYLELTRATFSDRYWETHGALEAQGKIDHPAARCPDRDGPREVHIWEPSTGWRTHPIVRAKVSAPPNR